MARRYFQCELGDREFYLQSLNSVEWMKASSHDNYLLMAGAMSLIDAEGHTMYAATEKGILELLREFLDDDAGLIHQFREMVAEFVFQAGVKKVLADYELAGIGLARRFNRPDWQRFLDELTPQEIADQLLYEQWLSSVDSPSI